MTPRLKLSRCWVTDLQCQLQSWSLRMAQQVPGASGGCNWQSRHLFKIPQALQAAQDNGMVPKTLDHGSYLGYWNEVWPTALDCFLIQPICLNQVDDPTLNEVGPIWPHVTSTHLIKPRSESRHSPNRAPFSLIHYQHLATPFSKYSDRQP